MSNREVLSSGRQIMSHYALFIMFLPLLMLLFIAITIFFVGACFGSFSAVLLEKERLGRSFWTGRSQCMCCKKKLTWYELIPLVSYAIQDGKCRNCHAKIPRWIWYMEWYIAFLWMIVFMILYSFAGFTPLSIFFHGVILTGVSLLVIEDIRFKTISDNKTLPLICILIVMFIWSASSSEKVLLPYSVSSIVIGGFTGMFFYMLQMIVPAMIETIRRGGNASHIFDIVLSPFIFPIWLLVKVCFSEKIADAWLPSISVYENLPSWVGGGDIRLGLIIGLLVGPFNFFLVVSYGYVLGTIYYAIRRFCYGKIMRIMPVAPLLFFGLCVVWGLQVFS